MVRGENVTANVAFFRSSPRSGLEDISVCTVDEAVNGTTLSLYTIIDLVFNDANVLSIDFCFQLNSLRRRHVRRHVWKRVRKSGVHLGLSGGYELGKSVFKSYDIDSSIHVWFLVVPRGFLTYSIPNRPLI
jgi:hypothetical protein